MHPDRNLTSTEKSARWKAKNPDRVKAHQAANVRRRKPIVYGYFYPDGTAAYVGRGTAFRAKTHKTEKDWWSPDLLLITMTADSEWHAMELEGKWGARYLPLHNKEGYRHAN